MHIKINHPMRIANSLAMFLCAFGVPNAFAQTFPSAGPVQKVINLVCIGDSITESKSIPDRDTNGAPAVLAHALSEGLGNGTSVYLLNDGISGTSTADWAGPKGLFAKTQPRISRLIEANPTGQLVFSIMLGTNDSANKGPSGAPASADKYGERLQKLVNQIEHAYPDSLIFLHHPTWYSKNTHNFSDYEGDSAHDRLQSYFSAIDTLVETEQKVPHPHIFLGDTKAYDYFEKAYETDLTPQKGKSGTFYLHPNAKGADALGKYWAASIIAELSKSVNK